MQANTRDVEPHLECAATFIHTAQRYQSAGQYGSMFGDFAVHAMGVASELTSADAVQADLAKRVPAHQARYIRAVAEHGQQQADTGMLGELKRCGERYGLLK